MASPTVTYSFTNGTVIDASQVNTNFNDIIASLTDSTKDLDVADISATTGTITNLTSTAATLTTGTIGTLKNTVTDVASTATINAMVNTTSYIRITGTTATTINGITAGTAGQIIHIESVSANLTFAHQSGSASGVNRLYCPTAIDFGVGAPCSVSLIYNGTALGWVVLANTRTNTVTIADGSATAPSLNFTGTSSNTGIYLLTTDSFAFAANGAYVGNFLGTGTSTQWNFGSATSGQFTFRSDGAQPVFNYNSNANFSSLATETYMYSGTNSQAIRIAGGNTSVAGGSLRLYGGTHATKADVTEFYNAGTLTGTVSSAGLWTIGASGGSQVHLVRGNWRVGNASGSASYVLVDGLGASDKSGLQILAAGNPRWYIRNETSANSLEFVGSDGSTQFGTISSSGRWTIGASAGTQGHIINGSLSINANLVASGSLQGTGTIIELSNDDNTTNSWCAIGFGDSSSSGNWSGKMGVQTTDVTNNYGKFEIATRSSLGSATKFVISEDGLITIGESGGTQIHQANGNGFTLTGSPNSSVDLLCTNTATTSLASAALVVRVASSAASNPSVIWQVGGAQTWAAGTVNNDSDKWALCSGGDLGSNQYLTISTAGVVTLGSNQAFFVESVANAYGYSRSVSGSSVAGYVENTSNSADSNAVFTLTVAGTSAGDAVYRSVINSGLTWAFGADNSDSDKFKISQNGTLGTNDFFTIDINAVVTLGATGTNSIHQIYGRGVETRYATAGTSGFIGHYHTDNTSGTSHSFLFASCGGASGGDPYLLYEIVGVTSWTVGLDNSDSDSYKICGSGTFGGAATDYFKIATNGLVTIGNAGTTNALAIVNQTDPGAVTDGIRIGSVDLSAGNATLSLRTETAVVTETVVSDRTLSVQINGTTYKICLKV